MKCRQLPLPADVEKVRSIPVEGQPEGAGAAVEILEGRGYVVVVPSCPKSVHRSRTDEVIPGRG